MRVFFSNRDREEYLHLLKEHSEQYGVEFLAYCLMANHVHLIAVPKAEQCLARTIGEAHRRYTRMVNFRQNARGYLFQGRFFSCPLDERYLLTAVRYVELNPVRAGSVKRAWDYRWSSARYHVGLRNTDALVTDRDLWGLVPRWRRFLAVEDDHVEQLCGKTRTGRPCGDEAFVKKIEKRTDRSLSPRTPGRPKVSRK